MIYNTWDIILIEFPFSDLSDKKLRPALVISNENFNKYNNLILIWIYWNIWDPNYSIELNNNDLEIWELNKTSYFRFHNIFSLDKKLIKWKIAKLKQNKLKEVKIKFSDFIL